MSKVNLNRFGQPVGVPLDDWSPPPLPPHVSLEGEHIRLEPVDITEHGESLYEALCLHSPESNWTYLPIGPLPDRASFGAWLEKAAKSSDPQYYVIVTQDTGMAVGVVSYMRIKPEAGSIEVGHIHYSAELQKTIAATEVMYLMMRNIFDLGYRRYEWKCDSLNEPSRRAALRLGFQFEGVFRQAICYKGRNRDTAWFSVIDLDWPALRQAYGIWLNVDNFDHHGGQISRLEDCIQQQFQTIV